MDYRKAFRVKPGQKLKLSKIHPAYKGKHESEAATVAQADEICVVDRGRIVDRGQHGELLAQGRTYSHIAQTQFPRDAA